MPYAIGGNPVQFQMAEFERLATTEGAKWGSSSLKKLRTLLQRTAPPLQRQEILFELNKVPLPKRTKYKKAIKYLMFHFPNMVPAGDMTASTGLIPNRLDFQAYYATMDPATEYVDLMYGISMARTYAPYQLQNGRVGQADDFNNASNIGTGLAFQRQWPGFGTLDATPDSTRQDVLRGAPNRGQVRSDFARSAHINGLLGTRYSPTSVYATPTSHLTKDAHKSRADMVGMHGRNADSHFWAHARFVKAVRRACKGGIAMVASSPLYTNVNAKIHFVLDGLGDLGMIARKDPLPNKGDYVAITTSELCFCCRYWDDPQYPLRDVVKFYVDGARVYAPWEADWTINDALNNSVISNQEAWKRYQLCRDVLVPQGKQFPAFVQGQVEEDAVV